MASGYVEKDEYLQNVLYMSGGTLQSRIRHLELSHVRRNDILIEASSRGQPMNICSTKCSSLTRANRPVVGKFCRVGVAAGGSYRDGRVELLGMRWSHAELAKFRSSHSF